MVIKLRIVVFNLRTADTEQYVFSELFPFTRKFERMANTKSTLEKTSSTVPTMLSESKIGFKYTTKFYIFRNNHHYMVDGSSGGYGGTLFTIFRFRVEISFTSVLVLLFFQ